MEPLLPPFNMAEEYDFLPIASEHPKVVKAVDCFYEVHPLDDKTVFRYFTKDEEGERNYFLPGNIWRCMMFLPPLGMGTELISADKLVLPAVIINEDNEEDLFEVYNDGIVLFKTEGNEKTILTVINWLKGCTAEEVFVTLGRAIYDNYLKEHEASNVKTFLNGHKDIR